MGNAASPVGAGRPEEESRSARKRRVILEAATTAFLRNGYLGTSMDEIAALAGVSKQTVYKHFADKERLFADIILGTIDQVGEPFYAGIDTLQDTDDLEKDLGELARRLITIVMQPQVLALRRLVIAEAERFPQLGRAYYERGPERTAATLASHFQRLAERGLQRLDDPLRAANHFNWLVTSIPLNQVMLCGDADRFTAADLEDFADSGVRVFLAAYGQP
jgi:TetR/AcrR family transcriptional regulator, mexJK operon transcriptional repressor